MDTQQATLTNDQWCTTIDNEIARSEWADIMLDAAAQRLGLMCVAMTGGSEYDRLVDTLEYADWQEDVEFIRRGC